jgi:DNA-binding Lrp family transcriptional regulator
VSVRAYVLIQTEVGRAAAVTRAVADIPGIETSEYVAGPYDVIARAATDSVEELGRVVVTRIQQVEGIARTLTCPIVSDE